MAKRLYRRPFCASSPACGVSGLDFGTQGCIEHFFLCADLVDYSTYSDQRPTVFRYVFDSRLYALGLMSKPMLVTVPFVLLLMDLWPLHRIQFSNFSDIKDFHQRQLHIV